MRGIALLAVTVTLSSAVDRAPIVHTRRPVVPFVIEQRVPNGGIQPQTAVDEHGTVHLIYFQGDPSHGDVFYIRSSDGGATFSSPLQVNHHSNSAIATGSVRGAQLAIGRNGRVHVAWNGSALALPEASPGSGPLLYSRLNEAGTAFEPERNIIQRAYGVDGGSAVTADRAGHVYVVWHAPEPGEKGEEHRRVWIARSSDDGRTFESDAAASPPSTGVCGCCALPALAADNDGHVLFAWTEGTAWNKGGSAAWQIFESSGIAETDAGRAGDAVPVWGLVSAYARPGGGFTVVY